MVRLQRLGDDIPHRHTGVQRGVRVLKDHLHFAADRLQLALAHMGNVLPVQQNFAGARLINADDRARAAAFAAAGLPYQPQGASAAQGKADIVHGVNLCLAASREKLCQMLDLQNRLFHLPGTSFRLG